MPVPSFVLIPRNPIMCLYQFLRVILQKLLFLSIFFPSGISFTAFPRHINPSPPFPSAFFLASLTKPFICQPQTQWSGLEIKIRRPTAAGFPMHAFGFEFRGQCFYSMIDVLVEVEDFRFSGRRFEGIERF